MKRVFVITNDSTVFLKKGLASAFEMFGGRVTEVKHLVARLDTAEKDGRKMCDVSFGIISTKFGFVPGNYVVMEYDDVMSSREDYERVQEEKDYLGQLEMITDYFDAVIVCVPKDMFALMLEHGTLPREKVIAVTNPVFEKECAKRGWTYLERKGARVGNENADRIFGIIEEMS
ncbi:MAG: hypothetical protein LBM39_00405 [Candidatus Methanoplasma sp.]|jgi:hypothetical protein|nr:hypothetical protein [Candidatus Methanoplasma sp.]